MVEELKLKLKELAEKKKELQPKLDEINENREAELENINKKYDHMLYDLSHTLKNIESEFFNDLITSFVQIVSREFDAKRSQGIYEITPEFTTYRELIAKFEIFPKELIQKLHDVINGHPIEEIVYELEDIQKKYMKS